GEGTIGKLLKDPKAYDDLVKLLGNIERNNVVKKLVRFVLEQDEASSSAAPTVAVPATTTAPDTARREAADTP
ncbi:MAG: MCE family protein, partial [Nannocystaceae bacterium]